MQDRPCTQPWHHVARRLWDQGKNNHEIAKVVSRHPKTVQRFLNSYAHAEMVKRQRLQYRVDPETRRRKLETMRQYYRRKQVEAAARERMPPRPCTQPWHPVALEMAEQGISQWEIAKTVGKSRSTVCLFFSPETHAKHLARQRQRRRDDPEHRARQLGVAVDQLRPYVPRRRSDAHCEDRSRGLVHREPTLPWHYDAIRLWAEGMNYKQIANVVDRAASTVARFLDSKQRAKWSKAMNKRLRRRYREDEEYRERHKEAARRHAAKVRASQLPAVEPLAA